MAEFVERTLFERALLASHLVDAAELVEAARHDPGDRPGFGPDSDARLADRLVARGLLNLWQVEQLRNGRTKFNLGPYTIVDAIGKGGMGHLFMGRHELLGRLDAVKVLPKDRGTPISVASFLHEGRALASLDHPNLVRVFYAGRDGDTYFLVLEYVPGADLRRLVRRTGALTPAQATAAILQTANALDYAHRRGLVHRDVKPGNLLVRGDGVVKLTDLGLAWRLDDTAGAPAHGAGKVVGTCDYLAPEAIRDPDRIVPVSDIYALGCTLYYAVTGKVPFPGGNTASKMRRQMEATPRDPRAFAPDLPTEIATLITDMMAKDHRWRTPSAAAVAERLAPFAEPDAAASLGQLVDRAAPNGLQRTGGQSAGVDIGETLAADTGAHAVPSIDGAAAAVPGLPLPTPAAPGAHDRPRIDQAIRLTVAAALGATAAILIAALLGRL